MRGAVRFGAVILGVLACAHVASAAGVWKVRDVAANSTFSTTQPTLKLESQTAGNRTRCTVIDTTGKDRAVTLAYCISLDAIGGT